MPESNERNGSPRFTRRQILVGLGAAGIVTVAGSSPLSSTMRALLAPQDANKRVIVNVFLRGGADGLNIVVPHGDPDYYRLRRSIGQQKGDLHDLDGFFGLHRAFEPLLPLYQLGELAFVHAAGSKDPERSHFAAMDNMDLAFGTTGWMQRVLLAQSARDPLSAVSVGSRVSPALRGPAGGIAFPRVKELLATGRQLAPARSAVEAMYRDADPQAREAIFGAFSSVDVLGGIDTTPSVPYPRGPLALDLREAAALIKADIGVKMVSVSVGGWDHHSDENPRMVNRGGQLAAALAAFKADLGVDSQRVLTLVMTEFGRTASQNGSGGTDHGHGSIMMVMGGELAQAGGGRVHLAGDRWVGLAPENLNRRRYLEVTTDFRSVLAEALDRHYGFADLAPVFPGFAPTYPGLLGGTAAPRPAPAPVASTPSTTIAPGPSTTAVATTAVATTAVATTAAPTTAPPTNMVSSTTVSPTGRPTVTAAPTSTSNPPSTPPSTSGSSSTTVPSTSTTGAPLLITTSTAPESGPIPIPAPTPARGVIAGSCRYTGGGRPAPGLIIDLFTDGGGGRRGRWMGDTRTDASGRYAFPVRPGNYVLTFIAPGNNRFVGGRRYAQPTVPVGAGQQVVGIDAELLTGGPDAASIEGSVTDEGGAVAGVTIDLYEATADGTRGQWLDDAVTDGQGRYRLDLQQGCYVLTFVAPTERRFTNGGGFYQPALCVDAGQRVTGLDARLR